MPWFNRYFLGGVAYITFVVGYLFYGIGEVYCKTPKTMKWYDAIITAFALLFPFWLGYKSKIKKED